MKVKKGVKSQKLKKGKKKKISTTTIIINSIAETLQANSNGEFELPSILTRYLDRSHPKHKLGLHREIYIPAKPVAFNEPNSARAKMIFNSQASLIVEAIVGEGIPIHNHEFDLPLCEDCQ